jgi:hypothetical protein
MDPMTIMAVGSLALGYLGQGRAADAAETQARYQYQALLEGLEVRREANELRHQEFTMSLMFAERSDKRQYRLALRTLESDGFLRLREIESNERIALAQARNEAAAIENDANTVASDILYN